MARNTVRPAGSLQSCRRSRLLRYGVMSPKATLARKDALVSRRAPFGFLEGRWLLGEHANRRCSPARARFLIAHCDPLDVALTTVKIDRSRAVAWIDPRCDRNVLMATVSEDDVEITEMNWISVDANPHVIERPPARQHDCVLFNAISSFSSAD